jgi:hypothetical protein
MNDRFRRLTVSLPATLLAVVAAAPLGLAPIAVAAPQAVIEDAGVTTAKSFKNFGTKPELVIKYAVGDSGTLDRRVFFRLTVSGVTGTVESATLRLFVTNGSPDGGVLEPVDASWTESTVTWDNQPPTTGPAVASLGPVVTGSWESIDLTSVVTGDGTYDFRLSKTTTNAAKYSSTEGVNPPQLVIVETTPPPPPDAVLVGAGDIAVCSSEDDDATADLLDGIEGTVFTTGDNAYPDGTAEEFADCYDPTWGRHKARTRPSTGNHDYHVAGAAPYFAYFGAAAGNPGEGWYSYDLEGWHVIVLNSNCEEITGCEAGSAQESWLRADLAASTAACTVAYWHHPRFSSGQHGDDLDVADLWQALYDADADVVLNGHDHDYERFAPQDPSGTFDAVRGIREFVVGTGGAAQRAFGTPEPNSEVRETGTPGVLRLDLHAEGYDWEFIPIAGKTFTDSGSGTCH